MPNVTMDNTDKLIGYQRQRRNLFLVSFALITLEFADVRLDTLSLQGYLFKVGNPEFIFWGMIGLLLYFGWRYYQYYMDCGYGAFASRVQYVLSKNRKCVAMMFNEYFDSDPAQLPTECGKEGIFTVRVQSHEGIGLNEKNMEWVIHKPVIHFIGADGLAFVSQFPESVTIPDNLLKKSKRQAWCVTFFSSTEFTEHYLPFLFSAIALLIALGGKLIASGWFNDLLIGYYH